MGEEMTDCPEPPPLWDDVAFRRRASELAAVRGLNLVEASERAGLSPAYCYKKASRHGRSIEGLLRLARALEVDVRELIFIRAAECSAADTTSAGETENPNR